MEDRSDVTLNSFSLTFLNRWKGANAQSDVDHGFDDDVSDLNEPIDDDIMFESDSDVWSQHAGLSDDFCPFDDTVELQLIEQLNSPEIEEGSDLKWKSKSAGAFLRSLGQTTDESLTVFIQSIVTLISSANQAITAAAMKMLNALITPHPKKSLNLLSKPI
ncbi:hypothetical protein BLNAU_22272 [Blattamonas nauphoetae]|uniref:Uncharacterized protein n=1 Tax=Blattamonas nauphoetae TaxID=2049346 RepID=A0ABQ9WTJ9_9EUKA|nr:hypothetical protein BLNAU_22272 [Blattamonas nauphoetae]